MNYTEEDVEKLHRTLHRLCGLAELPLTMSDKITWEGFLWQMEPIKDTEGGPFVIGDLVAVLSEMQRQKRAGAKWAMKPTTILRDPEKFRDMVLESRTSLRIATRTAARKSQQAVQRLSDGTNRITDDSEPQPEETTAREAALAELAAYRKKSGL